MLRFRQSTFAHGVKENQIQETIANKWGMTKWFAIQDDIDGNSQDMIIGFDASGILLEIGITYIGDDEVAFHADCCSPTWTENYNKVR